MYSGFIHIMGCVPLSYGQMSVRKGQYVDRSSLSSDKMLCAAFGDSSRFVLLPASCCQKHSVGPGL